MYYIQYKPHCETDCTLYEVFTNCEKLFTLRKAGDGNWITNEHDIIPIMRILLMTLVRLLKNTNSSLMLPIPGIDESSLPQIKFP